MLTKALKYLTALIILLHCIGATQLVSAYAKDKSSFVSMLTMTEEESKKEKESCDEDDVELYSEFRCKTQEVNTYHFFSEENIYFRLSLKRISYQFVIESPTPPPDFLA